MDPDVRQRHIDALNALAPKVDQLVAERLRPVSVVGWVLISVVEDGQRHRVDVVNGMGSLDRAKLALNHAVSTTVERKD